MVWSMGQLIASGGFEVWENFIVLSYEGQGVNLYRALPSRG
jgi:hypothetical protein